MASETKPPEKKRTLLVSKARYATALYDFLGSSEQRTLTIFKGDIIRIKEITDAPWWLAECNGVLGFVPQTFVLLKEPGWNPDAEESKNAADKGNQQEDEDGDHDLSDDDDDDISKAYSIAVIGTYNFLEKSDPRHLPFKKNDKFFIVEPLIPDQPWYEARLPNGEVGLVPANRVYVLKPGESEMPSASSPTNNSNAAAATSVSSVQKKESVLLSESPRKATSKKFATKAIGLKDYKSQEVPFSRGDVLDVDPVAGDWVSVKFKQKTGLVPKSYVQLIEISAQDDPAQLKTEFLYNFKTGNMPPSSIFQPGKELRTLTFFLAVFALKQGLGKSATCEDDIFGSLQSSNRPRHAESAVDMDFDDASLVPPASPMISNPTPASVPSKNRLSLIVSSVRHRTESANHPVPVTEITPAAAQLPVAKKSTRMFFEEADDVVTDKEVTLLSSQFRFHFLVEVSETVSSLGRQLFLVVEGSVLVDGMLFGPGEFFGVDTMLDPKKTPSNCSSASKNTVLMSLSPHGHSVLCRTVSWWEDGIHALHQLRSSRFLRRLALFQSLDEASLDILGMRSRIRLFKKGQILDVGENGGLFIVFHGVLSVSVKLADGTKRELRKVGRGQFFGEGTLFAQGVTLPTHTTASALSRTCLTLYLSNEDLEDFSIRVNAKARYHIAKMARYRLGQNLVPLPFAQVLETKLDSLAQAFEFALFERDEVIYQNSEHRCLYLVCEGEVQLVNKPKSASNNNHTQEDSVRKILLRPGMWFGERCLYNSFDFAASGTTTTTQQQQQQNPDVESAMAINQHCLCMAISFDNFGRFVDTVAQEFRPMVKPKVEAMLQSSRSGGGHGNDVGIQLKTQLPTSADELACTTNIPNAFLIQDPEATAAIDSLAEIGQIMAPCLKALQGHPQYMHPYPFDFGNFDPLKKFSVTIIALEEMDAYKVHTSAADTVGALVDHIFSKFQNLDPAGSSVFALKVANRAEYLLERDVELARYKCVTSAIRMGMELKFQLVDLRINPKSGPGLRMNKLTKTVAVTTTPTLTAATGTLMEAVALYDYDSSSSGGFAFKKGDSLEVEVRVGEAMWPATMVLPNHTVIVGVVPQNYVKAIGPIYVHPTAANNSKVTAPSKRGLTTTTHSMATTNTVIPAPRTHHTLLETTNDKVLLGIPLLNLEEWAGTVSNGFARVERMLPFYGKLPTSSAGKSRPFPFRIRLRGVDKLQAIPKMDAYSYLQVRVELVFAGQVIEKRTSTPLKKSSQTLRFEDEWIYFSLNQTELPLTSRICLTLLGGTQEGNNGNTATSTIKFPSTVNEEEESVSQMGGGGASTSTSSSTTLFSKLFSTSKKTGGRDTLVPNTARINGGGRPSHSPSRPYSESSPGLTEKMSALTLLAEEGNANLQEVELAGVSMNLFTHKLQFKQGRLNLGLWPTVGGNRLFYCVENFEEDCSRINFELDRFVHPYVFAMPNDVKLNESAPVAVMPVKKTSNALASAPPSKKPGSSAPSSTSTNLLGLGKNKTTTAAPHNRRVSVSVFMPRTVETNDNGTATPVQEVSKRVRELLARNPLQIYQMTEAEKATIWNERELLKTNPLALSKVMISVNWLNFQQRDVALELLGQWAVPAPLQALELLDSRFGEIRLREYAVRCLEVFDDEELGDFLLQLIQVLKFETFHDNALCRFLFRRALANPREIGNRFFWGLRSEMHVKTSAPRFGLILKAYLKACGLHFAELAQQHDVQELLISVGRSAQGLPSKTTKADRTLLAQQGLSQINERMSTTMRGSFQLPLDPKMRACRIIPEKSRIMSSKKRPMWITLENVDPVSCGGESIQLMFKCGDDLRQDQMTLQIFRVMEQIWLSEGMNLRLTPYGCISTGNEIGILEIVKNSKTIADIEITYGGKLGSFRQGPIRSFLEHHNKVAGSVDQAIDNFVHSCAGYCVAAYVMGLGDRHNDNLMVSESGHFFHIDFGHFLGNFKMAIGGTFKRERTPFVLTKGMVYAMGENFSLFEELTCRALNVIRSHGDELVTLFRLMVPAGMPELQNDEDIKYLVDMLHLGKTDEEVTQIFRKDIRNALGDFYKLIDNFLHTWKHQ